MMITTHLNGALWPVREDNALDDGPRMTNYDDYRRFKMLTLKSRAREGDV